jgi:dihydrodipicolinate synthase/N-acetylneuraminate lyase
VSYVTENGSTLDAAPFVGVGVALVTLFDDERRVDISGTVRHAVNLVDLGVQAVLVAGSTGEFKVLTDGERTALLAGIVEEIHGKAVVMAGVGASSTDGACLLTEAAVAAGADCVLSTPDSGDLAGHYKEVKDVAGELPVLAYHWPAMYPPGIDAHVLDSLPIVGCKDSTGDPKRLLDEVTTSSRAIYTGSGSLILMCSAVGGAGAIVAIANAYPELSIAAFAGHGAAQRELHLMQRSVQELPLPADVKRLTAERFGTSPAVRD